MCLPCPRACCPTWAKWWADDFFGGICDTARISVHLTPNTPEPPVMVCCCDQSWDELMDNQHDAFRCLAGHHEAVCGCEKVRQPETCHLFCTPWTHDAPHRPQNAYISVMAFVVCYMAFFYFLALLVKEVCVVSMIALPQLRKLPPPPTPPLHSHPIRSARCLRP